MLGRYESGDCALRPAGTLEVKEPVLLHGEFSPALIKYGVERCAHRLKSRPFANEVESIVSTESALLHGCSVHQSLRVDKQNVCVADKPYVMVETIAVVRPVVVGRRGVDFAVVVGIGTSRKYLVTLGSGSARSSTVVA